MFWIIVMVQDQSKTHRQCSEWEKEEVFCDRSDGFFPFLKMYWKKCVVSLHIVQYVLLTLSAISYSRLGYPVI